MLDGFEQWFDAEHPAWRASAQSALRVRGRQPAARGAARASEVRSEQDRADAGALVRAGHAERGAASRWGLPSWLGRWLQGAPEAVTAMQADDGIDVHPRRPRAADPAIMSAEDFRQGLIRHGEALPQKIAVFLDGIGDVLGLYHEISDQPGGDTARAGALARTRIALMALRGHQSVSSEIPALPAIVTELIAQIDTRLPSLMVPAPRIMHFTWIGEVPDIVQDYLLLHLAVNGDAYQYRLWHEPDASLAPTLRKMIRLYASISEATYASQSLADAATPRQSGADDRPVVARAILLQNMAWQRIRDGMREGRTFDAVATDFMVETLGAVREDIDAIRVRAQQSVARLAERARALGHPGVELVSRPIAATLFNEGQLGERATALETLYVREMAQRTSLPAATDISRLAVLYAEGGLHLDCDLLPLLVPSLANAGREESTRVTYERYAEGDVNAMMLDTFANGLRYQLVFERFPELLPARAARQAENPVSFRGDLVRYFRADGDRVATAIEQEMAVALDRLDTSTSVVRAVFTPMGERHAGTLGFAYDRVHGGHRTYFTSNAALSGQPRSAEIGFLLDGFLDYYEIVDRRPDIVLDNPDRQTLERAVDDVVGARAQDTVVGRRGLRHRLGAGAPAESGPALQRPPAFWHVISPGLRFDGLVREMLATLDSTGPGAIQRLDRAYTEAVQSQPDVTVAARLDLTLFAAYRHAEFERFRDGSLGESAHVLGLDPIFGTEEGRASDLLGRAAVRPLGRYAEQTRYDHLVVLQIGEDPETCRAARFLYNRHSDRTSWVKLDAQKRQWRPEPVVARRFGMRPATVRMTVIGHSETREAGAPARMSGYTGTEIARAIESMRGLYFPSDVTEMRISVVGCEMACGLDPAGGEVPEGFIRDLTVVANRVVSAPVDLTARSTEVFVDVLGRKFDRAGANLEPATKWVVSVERSGRVSYRPAPGKRVAPPGGSTATAGSARTGTDVAAPARAMPRLIDAAIEPAGPFSLDLATQRFTTRASYEARIWARRISQALQNGQHPGLVSLRGTIRVFGLIQAARIFEEAAGTARREIDFASLGDTEKARLIRLYVNGVQGGWDLVHGVPSSIHEMYRALAVTDLQDGARIGSAALRILRDFGHGLSGVVSVGNLEFDVYELAHAETSEDYRDAAIQLGLDASVTAAWIGETGALMLGSDLAAGAFGGVGLAIGFVAFVVAEFRAEQRQHRFDVAQEALIARYLEAFDAGMAEGGMRLQQNGTVLLPAPAVVIREIDLPAGRVRFGGPLLATEANANRFSGASAQDRHADAVYLRDMLKRPDEASLPGNDAHIVVLPTTLDSGIDFDMRIEPVVLRRMFDGCGEFGFAPNSDACKVHAAQSLARMRGVRDRLVQHVLKHQAAATTRASAGSGETSEASATGETGSTRKRRSGGPQAESLSGRQHSSLQLNWAQIERSQAKLFSRFAATPVATQVEVLLDDRARLLVTPELPSSSQGMLSYRVVGAGGSTIIVPAAGANYTLVEPPNGRGSWTIDARNLTASAPALRRRDAQTEIEIGGANFVAENPHALMYVVWPHGRRERIDARTGFLQPGGIDAGSGSLTQVIARLKALSAEARAHNVTVIDSMLPLDGLRDADDKPMKAWYLPAQQRFALSRRSHESVALAVREDEGSVWVFDPEFGSISAQTSYELEWMHTGFDSTGRLLPAGDVYRAGYERLLPDSYEPDRVVAASAQPNGRARLTLASGVHVSMTADDTFYVTGVSAQWADTHAQDLEAQLATLASLYEPTSMIVVQGGDTIARRYYDIAARRLVSSGRLHAAPDLRYLGAEADAAWLMADGQLHRLPQDGPDEAMGTVTIVSRNGDQLLVHGWHAAAGREALAPPRLTGVRGLLLGFDEGHHRLTLDADTLAHYREIVIDAFTAGAALSVDLVVDLPLMHGWSSLGYEIDGDDLVIFAPGQYPASLGRLAMIRVLDGARESGTGLMADLEGVGIGDVNFVFPRSNFASRALVDVLAMFARSRASVRRQTAAPWTAAPR